MDKDKKYFHHCKNCKFETDDKDVIQEHIDQDHTIIKLEKFKKYTEQELSDIWSTDSD